jgi:MtN3 and saliva related transmembrane protein
LTVWIIVIGLVAAALTTGAWLPQVFKTWRTRSARDFSWGYLAMFACGVVLWAVYGVLRRDIPVIAANVVTIFLVAGVIVVKLTERQ